MAVFKRVHIAPCGINCARCRAHLRANNPCPGCRIESASKPKTRQRCPIRLCDKRKGTFCCGCKQYPCPRLQKLDNRYRLKYAMSEIANLEFIRLEGITAFLAKEEAQHVRNRCIRCIHDGKMYAAG